MIAALLMAAAVGSPDLRLRCEGVARVTDPKFVSASTSNSDGDSANGSAVIYGHREAAESLRLEISGDGGRIRLPRTLVPPLHFGGTDGWWPLTSLEMREHEIAASLSLNILNKPKLRIDRTTGEIEFHGYGEAFRGVCSPDTATENKF